MIRWLRLHWTIVVLLLLTASALVWPVDAAWPVRLILGWDAGVLVFLVAATHKALTTRSLARIRERAANLDQAGPAILPLALTAASASVLMVLLESRWHGGGSVGAIITLATATLSWLFIHVIFAFHYAHAYYTRDGKGDREGLIFPGDEPPDYWDFLHFSLIIGVASQTADIAISDKRLRHLSTVQSLTAFVFNTVILALTVNLALSALGGG